MPINKLRDSELKAVLCARINEYIAALGLGRPFDAQKAKAHAVKCVKELQQRGYEFDLAALNIS